MMNFLAKADKVTSSSEKQYAMFCGRWQPLHEGHQYIFKQSMDTGNNILICIRDVKPDDKNPYTAEEVLANIEGFYRKEILDGKVKVIIIPDISSINFGRGVGYDIIEHVVPEEIAGISATKIREQLKLEGKL